MALDWAREQFAVKTVMQLQENGHIESANWQQAGSECVDREPF